MDGVLFLHPVCPREQSMPRILSIAPHSTMQSLPGVVTHEQTGSSHFLAFAGIISLLPTFGSEEDDSSPDVIHQQKVFLYRKEHIVVLVA
jgi:hypothetical protein